MPHPNTVIPFGKHRGSLIRDLDTGYLRWIADPSKHADFTIRDNILEAVNEELAMRAGGKQFAASLPSVGNVQQASEVLQQQSRSQATEIASLKSQLQQREHELNRLNASRAPDKAMIVKLQAQNKKLRSVVFKLRRSLDLSKRMLADGRLEVYELPQIDLQ